jgi:Cu/Ag efflux protein CusF
MKKAVAIIVSVLFVLSVAGLSFAAEKKAAPAAEKKEAAPAKAEEKKAPAKVKQVTGEVAAVDAAAKTLTVKGKKGDVALTADDKTSVMVGKDKKTLADVKAGDKVTVKYAEMNGKNVAKNIVVSAAPAKMEKKIEKKMEKKEAPKAEEKKPAAAPAPAEKKKTGGY